MHENFTSTSFILLHSDLQTKKHGHVLFNFGMQSPCMPVQQGREETIQMNEQRDLYFKLQRR